MPKRLYPQPADEGSRTGAGSQSLISLRHILWIRASSRSPVLVTQPRRTATSSSVYPSSFQVATLLQGGVAELYHQPLILFGELRREFGGRFIATDCLEPFRGQLGQTFALRKISM
jgi:hypothetical protein